MRFPTRPSTRSPLASQPEADRSFLFGGGGQVRPLFCPAKRNLDTRRNEVSNAYGNHEVGFFRGVAPGGVMGLLGQLPNTTGICDLCGLPPGCPPGVPRRQVLLGGGIFGNCRALQSRRAGCAFQENLSLAGLGLPRGVSGLLSCVEEATETVYTADNKSDSAKRVTGAVDRRIAHYCTTVCSKLHVKVLAWWP